MKTIYLAGPIHGCTDEEAFGWRAQVKEALAGSYDILDPAERDFRGREEECVEDIVEGDKTQISLSDILLANLWKLGAGTCMEILEAWDHEMPVIVVAQKPVSPWIAYHARIVESIDEAIELLRSAA